MTFPGQLHAVCNKAMFKANRQGIINEHGELGIEMGTNAKKKKLLWQSEGLEHLSVFIAVFIGPVYNYNYK